MKKFIIVIASLFVFSVATVLFLTTRDKIYLEEFNEVMEAEVKETTPFPIAREKWPADLNWKNGMEGEVFASPQATKGGTWNYYITSFPANFRQVGPDSNGSFRSEMDVNDLTLIDVHPETQAILPALAKEWAVGKDGKTVYYKLDPDARWDDGQPVTADDYIFALKMMRTPGIIAPWYNNTYSTLYDEVLKFDDYRIAVRMARPMADIVLQANLRPRPYHFFGNFRLVKKKYGISTAINYLKRDKKEVPEEFTSLKAEFDVKMKAHNERVEKVKKELAGKLKEGEELDELLTAYLQRNKIISPEEPRKEIEVEDVEASWVKNYNWKVKPRTGPYNIYSFIKGKEVVMKRNDKWWAKDKKYYKNRYNVDYINYRVLRDQSIAFEHFLKGQLDQFILVHPNFWHSKAKYLKQVDKGYMQKIWLYTDSPTSCYWVSYNMDHKVLSNIDVRLGITYAMNIQGLIDTVLHGDYVRAETFNEGQGKYTNKEIRARRFDLDKAISYFVKAGYNKIGDDGIRLNKKGERLSFKFLYAHQTHTVRLIFLKNEAKKAGLELTLVNYDSVAVFKNMADKKHELAWHGWAAQSRPTYWGQYHRDNAHKKKNNNLSNLDDKELSKTIIKFRDALNNELRIKLAHEIEQSLYDLAPAIPLYKIPYVRQGLWRWVKYPQGIGVKSTEYVMDNYGLFWIDTKLKKEILDKKSKDET
ncbi:MAG: ABC transporter substrate-binding protein, partial [Lentisphaeraceae bacterium]|nr:ABC transporter substrate-binding protein [Lentisphaeraceae bacterium]